jgi:hypothetical protein
VLSANEDVEMKDVEDEEEEEEQIATDLDPEEGLLSFTILPRYSLTGYFVSRSK